MRFVELGFGNSGCFTEEATTERVVFEASVAAESASNLIVAAV